MDRNIFSLFSDAKLLTEDGWSFDVHRIVLANKSTFFFDLYSNFPNDREPTLIPKFKGEILNEVLDYIYTDAVVFNKNNFLDIMIISDFLLIEGLYNLSKEFTESILSTENCLEIFVTSKKINEKSLRESSFRIILTNFEKLRNGEYFAEMPLECIMEILKDNSLLVTGENIVWEFITKWAERDQPNRFKEICCLLKCLKLEDIDESLANEIIQSDIISKNPYCGELQKMKLQKFESSLDTLKYIIHCSLESPEILFSKIDSRRLPDYLTVIVCGSNSGIYITYDEKLDLWRKVAEFADEDYGLLSCSHIIGDIVYVFNFDERDAKILNLYTQEWSEMENFFDGIPSEVLCSVVVGSKIYLIFNDAIHRRQKVKVYNTENGLRYDAMPMYSMSDFQAVSLLNKIFVVGQKLEHGALNISVQIYDEGTDSWSFIPSPTINRSGFSLTAYHNKLYIFGGVDSDSIFVKIVEVFNDARNEWERIDDLPLSEDPVRIAFCTELVLNDQLFAFFDVDHDIKQFVLNETSKTWVEPEKLFPVKHYFDSYNDLISFHTIYDRQIINRLVKQSRRPEVVLEKSPFQ